MVALVRHQTRVADVMRAGVKERFVHPRSGLRDLVHSASLRGASQDSVGLACGRDQAGTWRLAVDVTLRCRGFILRLGWRAGVPQSIPTALISSSISGQ